MSHLSSTKPKPNWSLEPDDTKDTRKSDKTLVKTKKQYTDDDGDLSDLSRELKVSSLRVNCCVERQKEEGGQARQGMVLGEQSLQATLH